MWPPGGVSGGGEPSPASSMPVDNAIANAIAASIGELAERMGHTKASISLDVYTHVMAPDEISPETIVRML